MPHSFPTKDFLNSALHDIILQHPTPLLSPYPTSFYSFARISSPPPFPTLHNQHPSPHTPSSSQDKIKPHTSQPQAPRHPLSMPRPANKHETCISATRTAGVLYRGENGREGIDQEPKASVPWPEMVDSRWRQACFLSFFTRHRGGRVLVECVGGVGSGVGAGGGGMRGRRGGGGRRGGAGGGGGLWGGFSPDCLC